MCEKETSERTLGTCADDPRSQSEDVCGPCTSNIEILPDISLVHKIAFQMSPDEAESFLLHMEQPQALEKPVERELIGVEEPGNTQNSVEMKEDEYPRGTKILTDESSKEDSEGMNPLDNNSILNVTTEHMEGKAFGTSLSDHPNKPHLEEDIYENVKLHSTFANQMTRSITEERQVAKALPDRFSSDCKTSFHPNHNTVSINNSAKYGNFIPVNTTLCGGMPSPSVAQKAVGIESKIPIQSPQIPQEEDFISISRSKSPYPTELQSPSLHVPRKGSSIAPNQAPLLAQVKQYMFVPNECPPIDRFSQNSDEVIIIGQKSGVLDSSLAQTGSGNPQIPLYMSQPVFSDSGQISILNSQRLNKIPNSSSRPKPPCSPSVNDSLKRKLTREDNLPCKQQKPDKDLLPKLDEFKTPF